MTTAEFRIEEGNITGIKEKGRMYLDAADLELWLRQVADSLSKQGAPEPVVQTIRAVADQFREAK